MEANSDEAETGSQPKCPPTVIPAMPEILYQSTNYLAVNKPWDIKINSNVKGEMSVEQLLRKMMPELVDEKCCHGFRFVHRLDKATSGVLCLALNRKAAEHLSLAFKKRLVTKYYLALVRGHLEQNEVYIDIPIGNLVDEDWPGRMCTVDHPDCVEPREAKTLLVCLERGHYSGSPASKILLLPITGRTHQLRVHCAHIGHCIVGDYTYSNRQDCNTHRMMLHADHLRADMDHEQLSIFSTDPFTTETDSNWKVSEFVCSYKDAVLKCEQFKQTARLYQSTGRAIAVILASAFITTIIFSMYQAS